MPSRYPVAARFPGRIKAGLLAAFTLASLAAPADWSTSLCDCKIREFLAMIPFAADDAGNATPGVFEQVHRNARCSLDAPGLRAVAISKVLLALAELDARRAAAERVQRRRQRLRVAAVGAAARLAQRSCEAARREAVAEVFEGLFLRDYRA